MTAASGVTVDTSDHPIPSPPNATNSSRPQSKGDSPTNQNEKETKGSAPEPVASEPAAGSAKQDPPASDEVDDFGLPIRARRPDPTPSETPEGENASQNIQNVSVSSTGYSDAVKKEKEPDLPQGKLDSGAPEPANPNNTEERGKGAEAQDLSLIHI